MDTGNKSKNAEGNGRKVQWAVLNGTVLVVLAFVLLFTGYLEGGAFVSLLTLALLVGLLTLFGDRIYQVSLFGSEIRLRRIEQDAAQAIGELHRSRIDNYRTSLRLSASHAAMPESRTDNGRTELVIDVVRMIHDAELTTALAQEIVDACRSAEVSLTQRLALSDASVQGVRDLSTRESLPSSERLLALYEGRQADGSGEERVETGRALDDLRELVRLRHQAQLYL